MNAAELSELVRGISPRKLLGVYLTRKWQEAGFKEGDRGTCGELIGVSGATFGRWLNGVDKPTDRHVPPLAALLGMSARDLADRISQVERAEKKISVVIEEALHHLLENEQTDEPDDLSNLLG